MREIAEKAAREREVRVSKLEKQLAARTKELDKVRSSMVPPGDLFRTDEFKEWDEKGVPTVLASGEAVSGGQMKKRKKAIDKQAKAYGDLMERSGGDPQGLVDAAQREVDEIKAKLDALSLDN